MYIPIRDTALTNADIIVFQFVSVPTSFQVPNKELKFL